MDTFNMDPVHHFGLPQLSLDCCLLSTGERLELLASRSLYKFFENARRGGLSFTATRYVESSKTDYISYIDANNLYGHCQMLPQPISHHRWMTRDEIDSMDWMSVDPFVENGSGYWLEVDLKYPKRLHINHSQMPMAPHRRIITESDFSPYMKESLRLVDQKTRHESMKLTSTFEERKAYPLTLACLQFYVKHGLVLSKIRRAVTFQQRSFIAPYIAKCTAMRKKSQYPFQSNIYKTLSCSLYGKLGENVRGRFKLYIVRDRTRLCKYAGQSNFHSMRQINEGIVFVFLKEREAKLCKPIYCAATILDYAKLLVFRDYYECILPLWPQLDLLCHDTDSLIMCIKESSEESFVAKLKDKLDLSNFPIDHPLFDGGIRKNQLGYWKIETKGRSQVNRGIALRAKCYVLELKCNDTSDITIQITAKGVNRAAARNQLTFQSYEAALFHRDKIYTKFSQIRTMNFQVNTIKVEKCALSSTDDKRYILPCGIHTIPYGSIEIPMFHGKCRTCDDLPLPSNYDELIVTSNSEDEDDNTEEDMDASSSGEH